MPQIVAKKSTAGPVRVVSDGLSVEPDAAVLVSTLAQRVMTALRARAGTTLAARYRLTSTSGGRTAASAVVESTSATAPEYFQRRREAIASIVAEEAKRAAARMIRRGK